MKAIWESIKQDKKFYALLLIILLLVVFRTCVYKPKPITPIDLKPELIRQDSFRTVIKYHDSTKVKTVINHRTLFKTMIKDSTKCYTEIIQLNQSCETVIEKDSILISSLYGQHRNDSIIDLKKDSVIVQKSDSIKTLTRKLKWAKLKTKGVIALWLAREAVGVVAKIAK